MIRPQELARHVVGLPVQSPVDGTVECGFVEAATTTSTVDDPPSTVGEHTSIALGVDGLPVIGYYDITAGALKVASAPTPAAGSSAPAASPYDPRPVRPSAQRRIEVLMSSPG